MSRPLIEKNTKKASSASKWAKTKTRNGKNRAGANGNPFRQIERWIKQGAWKKARALIEKTLVLHPEDHWLWIMLGSMHYELRDYEKALKVMERAVEMAPDCPLALWHYAGALSMMHQEEKALAVYKKMLAMDLDEVAYGAHGEGMKSAKQLLNDVHFQMGRFNHWLSDDEQAKKSFGKYLHNRRHGVTSIYKSAEAKKYLADMEREPATKKWVSS